MLITGNSGHKLYLCISPNRRDQQQKFYDHSFDVFNPAVH
jgi:hypothetical protein